LKKKDNIMTLTPDMQARKEAIMRGKRKFTSFGWCMIHARTATLKDEMGNAWCSSCQQRHDLINWGKAHEWPLIHIPPFAIGPDSHPWFMTVLMGRDEAIQVFHAGLIGGTTGDAEGEEIA